MVRNKAILIGLFILFGLSASAQENPQADKVAEIQKIHVVQDMPVDLDLSLISLKKVDPISADPKSQNKSINYGKSQEIISVKAYIKKLHMKRKETLMS